jgi:membrane protein YdbS with pleckstrin-like domain
VDTPTPEPTRRLPPEARGYFVLGGLLWSVPLAIGGLVVGAALAGGDVAVALVWLVRATGLVALAVGGLTLPLLRWRCWRYEIRDEEIDLLRGALVVKRTLVPMARVQHVDTERTVLSDMFNLRSVTIHTAAGSHGIPALRPHEATAMRDRIALLARRPEDL